jgi:hypothetical protein
MSKENKTKEEVLDDCLPDIIEYPHYNLNNFQLSVAYEAMDEWAKIKSRERAIAFMRWKGESEWCEWDGYFIHATTEEKTNHDELYNLFLLQTEGK